MVDISDILQGEVVLRDQAIEDRARDEGPVERHAGVDHWPPPP